jgi:hypothetical protein
MFSEKEDHPETERVFWGKPFFGGQRTVSPRPPAKKAARMAGRFEMILSSVLVY